MLGGIRIQLQPLVGTFQRLQARSWPRTYGCRIPCECPHQIPREPASLTSCVPPRVLSLEILQSVQATYWYGSLGLLHFRPVAAAKKRKGIKE
ncbi:hypothetical protein TIFTF001_041644 [Ficus carica]|uniref:Uncharacterized protein n=1 Tax=Ficus carica TaxID=3494 RepID=A0AA87ZBG6_FICCA|nr:hypothetical protein TIFTF001_041644 [Ficus carica]